MIFARGVNALLRAFDAHAQILPLEYYRAFLLELSKDYYGVGFEHGDDRRWIDGAPGKHELVR